MSLLVLGAEHRVNNVSKNVIEVTNHENNRTQNIHVACRSLYSLIVRIIEYHIFSRVGQVQINNFLSSGSKHNNNDVEVRI